MTGPGTPPTPAPASPSGLTDLLLTRCSFPAVGTHLVCAVSGGADSLALLVLAVAAGCRVTAVHVDHGLRDGSGEEADVVADAARRYGAGFRAERVELAPGSNLEARARSARRAVLPPGAATGHTMDDQAETVLLNLLRGAALDGLSAMRPGPEHPLLGIRRADTRAVCTAAGLRWVEDPSNADPRHLRNRVRRELLPLCADLAGRDPVPVLARQAALVADETSMLELLSAEAVPDPTDARRLAGAPAPLARRAVRRWLRAAGHEAEGWEVAAPSPESHPPSSAEVARVLSVAAGRVRATELRGGRRVWRSAGRLAVRVETSGKVTAVKTGEAETVAPGVIGPEQAETVAPGGPVHGGAVPEWAAGGVGPTVITAEQLAAKVAELGARITADYADDPPLLVGVLKGAMIFMSDLCRAIELPVDVDFMAVSSYGSATRTSGVVRIVKDLDADLAGRHVLVVEDIIDSGLTLNYLRKYLAARRPESVEVCALMVKEGEQRVQLDLRYVGFTIPADFVVGYGLDVAERFRNLRGVHIYLGEAGRP